MATKLTSLVMYKWRFFIGYGLLALFLLLLLIVSGIYSPGGLSNSEINSLVQSSNIDVTQLNSSGIINAPYHLFQDFVLSSLGVNEFSIKLPSLIIGFFTSVGLIILLNKWFKGYIAMLASFIAITTGQLLFLSQNGTPTIMYVFWSVWLLLFATLIAKKAKFVTLYKILFFFFAALSLYTPLSIYVLIALVVTAFLHPHLRFIVLNLSKLRLSIAVSVGLLVIFPLIYQIYSDPGLILTLLGVPNQMPNFVNNLQELFKFYLGFASPSAGEIMTPVFGMGSMALVALGINNIVKTRATAQSYLIIVWCLCLIPVIIISPSLTAITLLPLVLLLAAGLDSLITYWYKLFPRNPYARIAGFIPISLLILSLSFSGLERYYYGYHYDPNTASSFSKDLSLLPKDTTILVVSEKENNFYNAVAKYNNKLIVTNKSEEGVVTYTKEASKNPPTGYQIQSIITSGRLNDPDRFYIFKKLTT